MEAVPKLSLISFELKNSPENTQFGPKLKQYIGEAYREDPDSYSNEIYQLESLRSAAVRPTSDVAGLAALYRYFCQLRAIQTRFPMAKGQSVACNFAWKDLYANMTTSLADIHFELAAILYNIGALHTKLGASEPRTSPDSLKSTCTHFQNAAWVFQSIRDMYPQTSGIDIAPEIMRFLQEICFAQAQECILEKSIQDSRKSSVIGAVATQVHHFYKNALALLGPSAGTDNIHEVIGTKNYNAWHRYLTFKSLYIECIVSLYQAMNAEEQQKMGERVAFCQHAVERLACARKLAKYIEPVQTTQEALTFTNDVVEGKRKAAKNENEFIYHEEVPAKELLVDFKPVCLVKALPINFNDPEVSGPDIFSRLVPIGAHESSSVYSEEKAKLLRHVVGQAETKNTEITEFMSSLQLDQLDVLDSDQNIPQEIVDRCAAMNARAEIIQTLVDSMNNLAEIIGDVEHSLAEIKNLIQDEAGKEKEYQKVMGPRPPSIVQTELSREYHKYLEAHTRTQESNSVLHKAMTLHVANLRLLALPLDQLALRIPTIHNIEGLDREAMSEIRRVVSKAKEMQTQRDSLIQQLRQAVTDDDITGKLLARGSDVPVDQIFKQELEKHTPTVKIIEQNLAAQENIINKMTSLYASYGESRRLLTDVLRKRESLINALMTSYDSYEELLAKSQKGLEFYKKLSHNVNQLLSRLRSTCQVQEEERAQLLSKQSSKAPTPVSATSRTPEPAVASEKSGPKLKDYLPYMKNRGLPRSVTPQASIDPVASESYYPDTIYPNTVRPAPLGSEATDMSQMQLPDGVISPQANQTNYKQYDKYSTGLGQPDLNYTATSYAYSTSKPYDKQDMSSYGYSSYTPQYSNHMANQQIYSNPYYSGTADTSTTVSDSQSGSYVQPNFNPNTSQYNSYDTTYQSSNPVGESLPYSANNQTELTSNFAQIQLAVPKSDQYDHNYAQNYSQTYYMEYPQATTPIAFNAVPQSDANIVASTSEYIPNLYNADQSQFTQGNVGQAYVSEPQYSYGMTGSYNIPQGTQGYSIYTNADNNVTYTTVSNITPSYTYSDADKAIDPIALAQIDALDKPIKSHVTGEALTVYPGYQTYDQTMNVNYPVTAVQPATEYNYSDHINKNYTQQYQNHPGYNYNATTGNFDYNYGSQNSYTGYATEVCNTIASELWNNHGVYTSAGICETMQSPSETIQNTQQDNNQTYYNNPYGYQTNIIQTNVIVSDSQPVSTNYCANINQSTYMQSGHEYDTSVTYSSNDQVTSPTENVMPTYEDKAVGVSENISKDVTQNIEELPSVNNVPQQGSQETVASVSTLVTEVTSVEIKEETKPEKKTPTAFDLLADIDFTIDHKPLMPEIKVPQISESALRKTTFMPKEEPVPKPPKEEVIERPAKVDLFTDPSLLNKFTQEVKKLQMLVDSLPNKTPNGLTVLDSKWKTFEEIQVEANMNRLKSVAMKHFKGNILTKVIPYDDSRLTMKSEPNVFINASHYKQLASWCIPLVISKNPAEDEYRAFWKAMLENKITCIVCLLSEIEMQGETYWPTAIGQTLELGAVKVTLDEVTCSVHWTERRLSVVCGKTALTVTHYQINVFPAKIVCSPLVLLADKVLNQTYDNRLSNQLTGACIQCAAGAGRSALLGLLLMIMCQVRAGQLYLCDMLDAACINLYKGRSNVLEDTKYLADAYKTALFYVQGVLCSGTTMFNGEAVLVPTGASILPPVTPTPSVTSTTNQKPKFSKESFEEMKQSPGLKSGDMKDPLNFLDPLWSLKKK